MPLIWFTGISHSLKLAASWSSANLRSSRSRLVFFLVREAGGVDGGQLHEVVLFAGQSVVEGLDRVVGDLVVVALVAQCGGELGIVLELVLPIVLKESVESFAICLDGGRGCRRVGRRLRRERGGDQ